MSQLSVIGTLRTRMSTSTSNLYVLSCIGKQYRGMSDTTSKDPGKEESNNQNVQWILVEARDDGRNINIVTRGGTKIGSDAFQ
jgi:hypothetical protein